MDGESAAVTEAVATATGRSVTTMKAGQHRKEVTEVLSTARGGLGSQKSPRRDGTRASPSPGRALAETGGVPLSDLPVDVRDSLRDHLLAVRRVEFVGVHLVEGL